MNSYESVDAKSDTQEGFGLATDWTGEAVAAMSNKPQQRQGEFPAARAYEGEIDCEWGGWKLSKNIIHYSSAPVATLRSQLRRRAGGRGGNARDGRAGHGRETHHARQQLRETQTHSSR